MSLKVLDAVRNFSIAQLTLYMRKNYNLKVKSPIDGSNALMIALEIEDPKKRFRMFEFLLRQDLINILDSNDDGLNVFFVAVIRQREAELGLLMKNYYYDMDWNTKDKSGKTLLHYAVMTNNLNILEMLLSYCAKYAINVDIEDSETKLTLVVINHDEIV
jgi:ankyrin repeat protein